MLAVYILLAIVVVIVLWWVATYNRLVRLREMFRNAWSQIDVQLKRRHDLIPNLVETVKGYAAHERQTLEAVTQARQLAVNAKGIEETQQAENQLTSTLRSLFAVAESYPDLKANQNFLALQEELTATENKIAFARQHYNDVVNIYDAVIQTFPASIIANSSGFTAQAYFQMDEAERAVPDVKF